MTGRGVSSVEEGVSRMERGDAREGLSRQIGGDQSIIGRGKYVLAKPRLRD